MKMLLAATALLAGFSTLPASAGPVTGPTAASPMTITDMSSQRARGQLKKIVPTREMAARVRALKPRR